MSKYRSTVRWICLCFLAVMMWSGLGVAAESQVTLTVFVREGMAGGSRAETEWERTVFAEFEKEYPYIKLELVSPIGSSGYLDKLTTLWAAGQPPDVWDHGGAVATYVKNGWLLDLMPYVERDKDLLDVDDFFPGAWNAYQNGRNFWGMPHISMPSLMWYNADLLDQAGLASPTVNWDSSSWTWDEMVDYARKLTRIRGSSQVEQAGIVATTGGGIDAPVYSYMWGGDWFDEQSYATNTIHEATILSGANFTAYDKLAELHSLYGQPAPGGWTAGTTGMYLNITPLGIGRAALSNGLNFRWGLAPMPIGTERAASLYTDPWMISSQTKHPEEAWLFVRFMTSQAVMESYTAYGFGLAPVARRTAVEGYIEQLSEASGSQSFAEILQVLSGGQKYGREVLDHRLAGWPEVSRVTTRVFPRIMNREISVQAGLTQMQDEITAIIDEFHSR